MDTQPIMSKHPIPAIPESLPEQQPSTQINNPTTSPADPITDQDRYSRQILFPGIGPAGQSALAHAHVAIVGVGATGAATASLLARAGVEIGRAHV